MTPEEMQNDLGIYHNPHTNRGASVKRDGNGKLYYMFYACKYLIDEEDFKNNWKKSKKQ